MPRMAEQSLWLMTRSRAWTALRGFAKALIPWALYHSGLMGVARSVSRYYYWQRPTAKWNRLQCDDRPKFGILCYHRVGTEGVPIYSRLKPQAFEAQMRFLKSHYRVVSLAQLCAELREGQPVPPTLAITFDDGYRDLYTFAFPVLQRYQIPATIYLIGRCMETGQAPWYDRIFLALSTTHKTTFEANLHSQKSFSLSSQATRFAAALELISFLRSLSEVRRKAWCEELERQLPVSEAEVSGRMLSWEQTREMRRGGIDFGAHTMTHPVVSRLDPNRLAEELADSKRLLESGLDAPVLDFAYPFGKLSDINQAAESFVARCGYRSAVTTIEGYNSPGANPWQLRRLQIDDSCSLENFAFNICRMFLSPPQDADRLSALLRTQSASISEGPPIEVN